MTGKYSLRSQDHDTSSYAALPGTLQTEFVPHNMTPMKSNLASDKEVAGCHPSRWIYELINNDFTVCDIFERARNAQLDSTYTWDHPHKLVINGNQSFSTPCSRILSSICLDCHFHFVFKMGWDQAHDDALCHPGQSQWPLQDNNFPWHHLTWVGSVAEADILTDQSKYYPLLAREHFVCSAPPCTFQVTLEVSEPRMSTWWVKQLLDRDAILEQLRSAKEQEPSRYEGATDDWADQAPLNLNTYLKNLLESSPDDVRSISKRNKRFAVLFGPRCFSIFHELEFTEQVTVRNGVDEGLFTPTPPAPAGGPSGTTELGTYRAFLEDVRAEVQCLIHKAGQAAERPTYCVPVLHADLNCQEVPDVGDNALVNIERYKQLGVLPNQSREIIVSAYKRQWELLPTRRRVLVEALMGIANDTGDERLSDYAMTQSSVFESQLQRQGTGDDDGVVSQALAFLGLQPPNNYSSDTIIQAFRQKVARDPTDAVTARSMLMLIARTSSDDLYQAALLMESDSKMSLETAGAILGLSPLSAPWQTAVDIAKKKLGTSKGPEETEVYLDALEAVADHTKCPALKEAVTELRQQLGVVGTSSQESRAIVNGAPVDWTLPVGLHNIGNTCYLNSLLQYLFTVKPIRDIVLHYDDLRLDLTDSAIKSRLLGGNKMQMDRGEAVVAQAFAKELAILFRNLESSNQAATRPSQRLANAVLLSTHTLLHSPKQASEQPATALQPPPLPARPSPALPPNSITDVEMTGQNAQSASHSMELESNSSSKTLVDQDDAKSDHSFEKVDPNTLEREACSTDSGIGEMEEVEDTKMIDARPSTSNAAIKEGLSQVSPKSNGMMEQFGQGTNDDNNQDAEMIDQKVLNALEHQKRSSGTDQQDVEEVMGSIINRLQAAIRPSSVDEKTGIQLEKIMQTFFVTTVNYTKKFDENIYQHEISFDRSITAFPAPDGPCSLYDALGRNFDQQILEESKLSRYTAIQTLPPVLHVLIQRSQSMGSKNGNPVVIPEILYLDRYMDAPHDSPVFRRRVEDWALADRISDLKSLLAKTESEPSYMNFLEACASKPDNQSGVENTDLKELKSRETGSGEQWDFDGPVDDDFLLINPVDANRTRAPDMGDESKPIDARATHAAIREMMDKELAQREKELDQHHDSMKNVPYRLHAVICHRGQLMSGHYWVWICDFEDRVWRWYNDAEVKENRDTAEVLNTLSTSGEPYFLCYVRDEDKENFVDVPKRQRDDQPSEQARSAVQGASTDADGDLVVLDAGRAASNAACEDFGASPPEYRIE
ncbi:hypothetical protein HIM_03505 [Hirsutella minnesotensis 3608]|uniref:ubiquitinyl hydrolase 1 n=1 Tax=Hirsutella minnesotensis 3608 TaxID=1043627 RepID=A0A0F8A6J4_9HYPO|nr:hypothetical protein HIM_03505 [Hirsutella minnesotensis 3608]